jgi:glycosyltransferase involved in cell wall biosynthesis
VHSAKNILFIIPEMSMGGAQRSVAKISNALKAHHNVWVVVFNKSHAIAKGFQSDLLSLDVKSGNGILVKVKAFITRVVRLRALKKRLNIDVSISFLEGADYVNILSSVGDKVILSVRGSKVHDENMHRSGFRWRKRLIQFLYRRADAIVCVNNGIAREMREFYSIKNIPIHTIYNFYDAKGIQYLANQELSDKVKNLFSSQTIVMSGRLAPEKGNSFIIRLFAEIKKKRVNVRMILVGDGTKRNSLIALAQSLGLMVAYTETELSENETPDIFITGDQENVFKYLKHGTLYILNSSSEGFSNGLAEAMICGLPVIAADCPYGPREMLSDIPHRTDLNDSEFVDYGILLPMPGGNPSEYIFNCWFSTISKLLASEELRRDYGNKGFNRMQDFTAERIVQKWNTVIEL